MRKVQYAVARLEELQEGRGLLVNIGQDGTLCALFLSNGRVWAVGGLCPHQNAPLQDAPLENGLVVCRRHGFRFDLRTGDCRTLPGYGLPVYETDVSDSTVYVAVWEDP